MNFRNLSPTVLFVLLLGFLLRMALATQPLVNFDLGSYIIVNNIVHAGGNVYAETSRYNYSPVWFNIIGLLNVIPLALPITIRAFLSVVDTFNGLLLMRILGQRAATMYWLSPVAILITGFHGQFDTLSVTPLLLAMAFYQTPDRKQGLIPWAMAALAILIKHLIVFSAWTLLVYRYGARKAAGLLVLAGGVLVLSFVPYLPEGADGILNNVILYRSINLVTGMGYLPSIIIYPLFLAVMGGLPFLAKRLQLDEREAMGLSGIALIAFIPGTSPQYWVIVAIFGLMLIERFRPWYTAFTAVTSLALLMVYASFNSIIAEFWALPALNAVWAVCISWTIALVVRARNQINVASAQGSGSISGAPQGLHDASLTN